jgi:putative acetyltransferase
MKGRRNGNRNCRKRATPTVGILRILLIIRSSTESDLDDVRHVQKQAFGNEEGPVIADLVDELLNDPSAKPLISLLAVIDDRAVGHILFTKARVTSPDTPISAVILAPLAVAPDAQSQGIGGRLIKEGLRLLTGSGVELVFVLGHPKYYSRHGFKPAGVLGFEASYPIPDEHADAWMVQELRAGVIGTVRGKVICADALNRPEHWRE